MAVAACRLRPDHWRALTVRGLAHLQANDPGRARADFDAALQRDPAGSLARLGLARALERTAPPGDALRAYEAARNGAVVRAHRLEAELGRHRALLRLGRLDEANAALTAARAIAPARRLP